MNENRNMTANSRYSARGRFAPVKADMSSPTESAWAGARTVISSDARATSRKRLQEARDSLLFAEQEYLESSAAEQKAVEREVEAIGRKIAEINAEAWAIEREAEVRLDLVKKQVAMENMLSARIRDIAERSALSVLDRIKEASDSMLDWAGDMADDMSEMMKQEASEQAERKASDIHAIDEAIEDEKRTIEMLGLAARYKNRAA